MTQSAAASIRIGELAPGTELIVDQRGYKHHGIYVGGGQVVHYRGWISTLHGLVEEIPWRTSSASGRTGQVGTLKT